jgi:hypothetical protein
MGSISSRIRSIVEGWLPSKVQVSENGDVFYILHDNAIDGGVQLSKFSNDSAYLLAGSLAEVFFPIDAIAERVSALPFNLVNQKGEVVTPEGNVKRLLESPNVFSSLKELLYNLVFSELASGNSYVYTRVPSLYKEADPSNISSIWGLMPDKVEVKLLSKRPNIFDVTSTEDFIEYYQYTLYDKELLNPRFVIHERSLPPAGYEGSLKSKSPLCAVERNVNNLLAVYAARYKVYVNNGMAGILSKAPAGAGDQMQQTVDPVTRENIISDIMSRHGLTGDKRMWTVSAIPLSFIKTLATIGELQPFEETREDAVQIAGIFEVDKDLIPTKDGTTYANKQVAERNLYQNVVKGMAEAKADTLTKAMRLDKVGLRLAPDFSKVEVLQEDRKLHAQTLGAYVSALGSAYKDGVITGDEYRGELSKIVAIDPEVKVAEIGGGANDTGASDTGKYGGKKGKDKNEDENKNKNENQNGNGKQRNGKQPSE